MLAEEFKYTLVSVKDLLDREVNANSEKAEKIKEAIAKHQLGKSTTHQIVPDEIIIELINTQVDELEKNSINYIVVGYPRTRVQAMAMQRAGIVPDRFFILKGNESIMRNKLLSTLDTLKEDEAEKIVKNAILEYTM